jgi:hypothetical protein
MLAYRREDVRDLNDAARALLRDASRLGEKALVAGGRDFRAGDRVVCRRNDPALGVRYGTRVTVTGVDAYRGVLTLQVDAGPLRKLPAAYVVEHLDHGYALTGHAAQGATVRRAFVLVRGEGPLAEWAYVACSRAREETRVYGAAPELDLHAHTFVPARMLAARSLMTALGRSSAESLAVDQSISSHEGQAPAQMPGRRPEREINACDGRLAATQARLEGLGSLDRICQGRALRGAIDVEQRLLTRLRRELTLLQAGAVGAQPVLRAHSASTLPRERSHQPNHERSLGIEL